MRIIFALPLIFLLGCAQVKKVTLSASQSRFFEVRPAWARNTLQSEHQEYRVSHQMPALILGEMVIQGNGIDGIKAYHKKSGRLKWSKKISGGVEVGADQKGGTIFFGANDGFFYAVDVNTGKTKWTFPLRSEGIGRPRVSDNVVYFQSGGGIVYALSADTGEQLWFYTRPSSASITVRGAGRPYVGASAVYVGFSDGALLALSRERGAVLWERQLGDPVRFKDIDAEPAFSDGRLYVPSYDGKLFCLNLVDGKTIWAVEYGGFQTPIIEGGVIYTSTSQGKVVALEKATGKLIWERDFVSTVATTPALYKGLLLVGLWSGKFQALDLKTGKTVGGYSTGRGIASQPVVDVESDLVFATGVNGDLYAFKIGWYRSGDLWYWERQSSRL